MSRYIAYMKEKKMWYLYQGGKMMVVKCFQIN
jgi:hypothetical protein